MNFYIFYLSALGKLPELHLLCGALHKRMAIGMTGGLHVQRSEREAVDKWASVNCGGTLLSIETYSCAFLVVLECYSELRRYRYMKW